MGKYRKFIIVAVVLLCEQSFASPFCAELLTVLGYGRVSALVDAQSRNYKVTVLRGDVEGVSRTIVVLGQMRIKNLLASRAGNKVSEGYTFHGRGPQQPQSFLNWLKSTSKATSHAVSSFSIKRRFLASRVHTVLSRKELLENVLQEMQVGQMTAEEIDNAEVNLGYETLTVKEIMQELRVGAFARTVDLDQGRPFIYSPFDHYFNRGAILGHNLVETLEENPEEPLVLVLVGKRFAPSLRKALVETFKFKEVPISTP